MPSVRRCTRRQIVVALLIACAPSVPAQQYANTPDAARGEAMGDGERTVTVRAHYYEQFDADYNLDVPAEGFGGWKTTDLELNLERTAVVVMHAWDCGTYEEFPGWWHRVEYIPRSYEICRTVFPELLDAVRHSPLRLFHVVGGGDYYKDLPGYLHAVELAGEPPEPPEQVESDPVLDRLRAFKTEIQQHNMEDTRRGFAVVDFPPEARPLDDEGVAENAEQLLALCREAGVNHLIYTGFAINWCLLLSPGGMHDMSRHGIMCSTIREATTAVENRETAREELAKEIALWRVAIAFGYVFDLDDFVAALARID